MIFKFGSVAQSVARLLCNWKVPGSNPAEGRVLFLVLETWPDWNSVQMRI